MLSFLPGIVRGALVVAFALFNTLFWIIPILPVAGVKFLVRTSVVRRLCDRVLNFICTTWANWNKALIDIFIPVRWRIEKPDDLSMDKWYLVIANHQSWADILVLQYALNNVIPYFRFFLKKQLRWFPILNIAWWALDYPYMTRYSRKFLEQHPEKKGKDLETTRESCRRFRNTPVSVMNFVEGTRFTKEKKKAQNSPYRHLLVPRAGGVAFVVSAMEDLLSAVLDVTICYPEGVKEIWDFLCGRVPEVMVKIRNIAVTGDILGDYANDPEFAKRFQAWLNALWEEKDRLLSVAMAQAPDVPAGM